MLDAVLPLTVHDLDRAQILCRSIEANFPDLAKCFVVAPDRQRADIARALAHPRYTVLPETRIVPELAGSRVKGWYKQQLVKLAMAEHVASDYYLLLDADVICARRVRSGDLFDSTKALCHRYHSRKHDAWYAWAQRVLGMRRSGWVHGVTPTLLSRHAVGELTRHLNGLPPRPGGWWPRLAAGAQRIAGGWGRATERGDEPSVHRWRRVLLASLPWTEYALYFTFLEGTGRFEHFHAHAPRSLAGDCLWRSDRFEDWQPAARRNSSRPPFMVVQSIARIPPHLILQRVEPLLSAPREPAALRQAG
jgi:hypothetical protein